MKKNRGRRLRWRLAVPLTVAFAALWLGTMFLLTNAAVEKLEQTVSSRYQTAWDTLKEQREIYENNIANGLGAEADHIMVHNLSDAAFGLVDIDEGGMAILTRGEAGNEIRSQLAYGHGNEAGVDQGVRWYLYFDGGLDDAGQIRLAQWIVEHRYRDWAYALYPPDSWQGETVAEEDGDLRNFDGTYARVTGIEKPGYAIDVQKIELVHPDGTNEIMVQTDTVGERPITLELKYLKVRSVLLPAWNSSGKDGPINMERRLANFRESQAILDREIGGKEHSVRLSGGRMMGGANSDTGLVAGQCDVSRAAMQTQWFLYGSTLLLTIVVVLLLSFYLSRKVTEPVEELSRSAKGGRCREDGPIEELNSLAMAFNAAQEQLGQQLQRERSFSRAAAHELKTPLAVLRTHDEALREDIAPEKRAQYLDTILDESDRMAALVEQLLALSRLEASAPLARAPLELSELVRSVWQPLELQAEQKEITVDLALEEVWVQGDREQLHQAVGNLAANALRHCPAGQKIRVTLAREGNWACLRVYNDGAPIAPEDLAHLFEPFYRGDKSRSRESGGTGLGLAIVRAAALAHGGSCRAENTGSGVCFVLRLSLLPGGNENRGNAAV